LDLSIFSLSGRKAIVTGASKGIGRACALGLADAGADLVLASRNLDALKQVAKEIEAKGSMALPVAVDILKQNEIEDMVEKAVKEFGKIDILVNNAGTGKVARVENLSPADWDTVLNTNLKGPFLCCKAVLPVMKKQNYGRIINMASLAGIRGTKNLSCYNASKGGLMRFSESLALELVQYNITVNCICPGFIITDLNAPYFETEKGKMELQKYPMKRAGKLEEIVGALIYLSSESSSYVTASSIIIDGAQRWKGAL